MGECVLRFANLLTYLQMPVYCRSINISGWHSLICLHMYQFPYTVVANHTQIWLCKHRLYTHICSIIYAFTKLSTHLWIPTDLQVWLCTNRYTHTHNRNNIAIILALYALPSISITFVHTYLPQWAPRFWPIWVNMWLGPCSQRQLCAQCSALLSNS